MTEDPLAFARRLVAAGVPVFAAPPGGTVDGYQLPTGWQGIKADPRRLDVWRPGYALAAVCGHGLDVVDVDPRNGGDEALRGLLAAGLLPRTYAIVDTPRGGKHLYVASLGVGKTKRDGIDLQAGTGVVGPNGKTDRGFVWLPPTARHGGTYAVRDDSLDTFGQDDYSGAALLAWFHEARPSAATSSGPTPARELGAPIPRGEHQETLFRYACSLRARGVPEAEAEILVDTRAQDCVPPWGGPDSPWTAVRHAYRYEEGAPPTERATLELVRPPGSPAPAPAAAPTSGGRKLRVQRASAIRQRAARWLWHEDGAHWLPLGGLTLLGGREGVGKSTWGYRVAAQVTRGTLPGDLWGVPRAVIVAATEDAWEQTILPRLVAADADLDRVLRVDVEESGALSGLMLPVDTAALTELCQDEGVGLLLLDPLLGTIPGRLDTHKDAEVRVALEPLSRLAHECQLAIIGLIHENKSQGVDFLTRLMGSRAFVAVARAVLVCAEEKSELQESDFGDALDLEKGVRRTFLFGQEKNNLGPRVEHSLRYAIEGARTGYDDELHKDIWSSRISVVGISAERVAEMVERQAAASRTGKGRPAAARDAATTWMLRCLADAAGPIPWQQVLALGKAAGHAERTLYRSWDALVAEGRGRKTETPMGVLCSAAA